jgi:hypothetical protein
MADRHETAPGEYPLPRVGTDALRDVLNFIGFTGEPSAQDPALRYGLGFIEAHNNGMKQAVAEMLAARGLRSRECIRAALVSMVATHTLLHAQARIDRGLPAIDRDSDQYFLPVVTDDTINAVTAGATERAQAMGMDTYQDLVTDNASIPYALTVLGYPVVGSRGGNLACQAAEITAITIHAMLREQGEIDALNQQWPGGPLG